MSLAIKQARAAGGGLRGNVQQGGFFDFVKRIGGQAIRQLPVVGPAISAIDIVRGRGGGRGGGARPLPQPPPLGGIGRPPSPRLSPAPVRPVQPSAGVAVQAGMTLACPSGFHPNKSDYTLLSGEFVGKGSRCVRNRRRNPMNSRALDRAIGRVDAGKGLQGKLATITTAKWTASGKKKHPHG